MNDVKKIIKTIVANMFLDTRFEYRYFADILIQLRIQSAKIGRIAVGSDEHGRLFLLVDEEFFNKLSFEGKQFALAHEVLHIVLQHLTRGKDFTTMGIPQYIQNIAADLAVNSLLEVPQELKDTSVVPGYGMFHNFPKGLTFEEYVKKLLENKSKGSGKSGSNKNKGGKGGNDSNDDETIRDEKLKEADKNRIDSHEQWKEISETTAQDIVNKAREIAKRYHGNLPADLLREIEADYTKRFNWKFRIKSFVSAAMDYRKEITYGIPNRRFPDKIGEVAGKRNKLLGSVMIFVDTSGSISDEELKQFINVALSIPYPKEIYFIDAEIQGKPIKIRTVTGIYKRKIEAHGGGGTDFRPAFELAKQKRAKAIVYLTDMYGTFPDKCDIPTVWVTATEDVDPPFGEVINIRRFV
jgi:predicted metal-dependent peptidase